MFTLWFCGLLPNVHAPAVRKGAKSMLLPLTSLATRVPFSSVRNVGASEAAITNGPPVYPTDVTLGFVVCWICTDAYCGYTLASVVVLMVVISVSSFGSPVALLISFTGTLVRSTTR